MLEVVGNSKPQRYVELRKWVAHLLEFRIAALSDFERALEYRLVSQEEFLHLGIALNVELVVSKLQTVGVVNRLSSLDTHHHVLRVGVVFTQVVAVVGGDQRDAELPFQL